MRQHSKILNIFLFEFFNFKNLAVCIEAPEKLELCFLQVSFLGRGAHFRGGGVAETCKKHKASFSGASPHTVKFLK